VQTTTEREQLRREVLLLRSALFALGGFCILASLIIAEFRLIGPDAFYDNVVAMGFGFGIPPLILGLLTVVAPGPAQRHRSVRVLLRIVLAAIGSIVMGFILIGLAGDQRTPLGGVGFFAVLIGMITLPVAFLASLLAAIVLDTIDRHDQRHRAKRAVRSKNSEEATANSSRATASHH
jgi:uncharacterized membrane protein